MWYYVIIENHPKGGCERICERTLILNSQFSKEEIRHQMEKEHVDEAFITAMEEKGIFLYENLSFESKGRMIVSWENWDEDGRLVSTHERKFAKKYTVEFHPYDGFAWHYHRTALEKFQIWLWRRLESLKKLFHKSSDAEDDSDNTSDAVSATPPEEREKEKIREMEEEEKER